MRRYLVTFVSRLTGAEGVWADGLTKDAASDLYHAMRDAFVGFEFWYEKAW